jgi:chromosome segregation ATPase
MEKMMGEMRKAQLSARKEQKQDASTPGADAAKHDDAIKKIMDAQGENMRAMTKQMNEEHQRAAQAEAELQGLRSKMQEVEDRLHRSEMSKSNLERELQEREAVNVSHQAQPQALQPRQHGTKPRPAFTPAIKAAATVPLDTSMRVSFAEPRSPSAKMMHQVQLATMQLPPEDWADELSNVNAQLIEALEEIAAKEDELNDVTGQLAAVHDAMKDVHAKETLLYREHIAVTRAFQEEQDKMQKRLDACEADREKVAVKAARLDQLVAVLESEDGEGDPFAKLRDTVRDLTRQVAAYEVNQAIMARKHNLLKAENVGLQKRYSNVSKDFVDSK